MVDIKQITLQEFRDSKNVNTLIDLYADEARHSLVPYHNPDYEMYQKLEDVGVFKCIGAYDGDTIIGFAVLLINSMLHYSEVSSTVESIYVADDYRSGGTGIKLMQKINEVSVMFDAKIIFLSATNNSRIDRIASRSGFVPTHTTYMKKL